MRIFIPLFFILTLTSNLFAYEKDVHYGLTCWLAIQAGFHPRNAEMIAQGNQSVDDGFYRPATWAVLMHVITNGDINASKEIQRIHFPSYGPIPGEPEKRRVQPSSAAAHEQQIKESQSKIATRPTTDLLTDLGVALHPLQDSWSHQGIPDIPFFPFYAKVYPNLSYGHPADRDGWYSHNADITCLHPDDTVEMAEAVFYALNDYLNSHSSLRNTPTKPWNQIKVPVREFAEACDKEAKRQWFKSDKEIPFDIYKDADFLEHINTPGQIAPKLKSIRKTGSNLKKETENVPQALKEVIEVFLKTWIVERNISEAFEFIQIDEITKQLSALNLDSNATRTWIGKFLTMWLIQDHGLVNQMGHCFPNAGDYNALPETAIQSQTEIALLLAKDLTDAIEAPGFENPYMIVPLPQPQGSRQNVYAATFRFQQSPHDSIMIVFSERESTWKIVGMFWHIL
jgi:hypothetical protein